MNSVSFLWFFPSLTLSLAICYVSNAWEYCKWPFRCHSYTTGRAEVKRVVLPLHSRLNQSTQPVESANTVGWISQHSRLDQENNLRRQLWYYFLSLLLFCTVNLFIFAKRELSHGQSKSISEELIFYPISFILHLHTYNLYIIYWFLIINIVGDKP